MTLRDIRRSVRSHAGVIVGAGAGHRLLPSNADRTAVSAGASKVTRREHAGAGDGRRPTAPSARWRHRRAGPSAAAARRRRRRGGTGAAAARAPAPPRRPSVRARARAGRRPPAGHLALHAAVRRAGQRRQRRRDRAGRHRGQDHDRPVLSQVDPATRAILAGRQARRRAGRGRSAPTRRCSSTPTRTTRPMAARSCSRTTTPAADRERRGDEGRRREDRQRHQAVRGVGAARRLLGQELAQLRHHLHLHRLAVERVLQREPAATSSARCRRRPSTRSTSAEYIGKRLGSKPAEVRRRRAHPAQGSGRSPQVRADLHRGQRGQGRPRGQAHPRPLVGEFAKYGMKFGGASLVPVRPGPQPAGLTNMIAQLKGDGVTTVVLFVDPLYPILITNEATRQAVLPRVVHHGHGPLRHHGGRPALRPAASGGTRSASRRCGSRGRHVQKSRLARVPPRRPRRCQPGEEGVLINIYRAPSDALHRHPDGRARSSPQTRSRRACSPTRRPAARRPRRSSTSRREYPTEIKDFVEVFYDRQAQGRTSGPAGRRDDDEGRRGKRYQTGQWPTSRPECSTSTGRSP